MLCMEGNIESAKEALSKFSLKTLLLSISRVSFSFPFKNVSYVHVFLSAGEFRGGRLWGKGLLSYHDGSPGTEGYFQDVRFSRECSAVDDIKKARKVATMAKTFCETTC